MPQLQTRNVLASVTLSFSFLSLNCQTGDKY